MDRIDVYRAAVAPSFADVRFPDICPRPEPMPSMLSDEKSTAHALQKAQTALLRQQHTKGYWVGELQGDSILESEYILLKFILEQESDPDLPLIANYLRSLQQADGGWTLFPGGPSDLAGTVKAYFALKLLGDDVDAPHMRVARDVVRKLGGAELCNSFTRFYLAALGQISYDACPSIPPEIILIPKWIYFNLYAVSAWSRTMILPLAIVSAFRPVRKLSAEQGISELFNDIAAANSAAGKLKGLPRSWREMFLLIDLSLKRYEKTAVTPLRPRAIREAEKWLLDHLEGSEGLGAIFPPMVYILIVLRILGYSDNHPVVQKAHRDLKDLFIRDGDSIRIQPCWSPVWDTGIALHALAEAQISPDDPVAQKASQWLLAKECRVGSDWTKNCPDVEPSGWFFEFENPHYPDVDDTAMVAMALKRAGGPTAAAAVKRGVNWLLAMQNDDGGWAAFDRTRSRPILEHVPFADHNAIQDPSCPDIAGRTLECLGHNGLKYDHPAVRKAVSFLKETQEKEGCWFGRWGVNYIYGTWQVLTGLRSVGEPMDQRFIRRAADWLRSCQKPDGSWGESCQSYDNPELKGRGPSTPSQTAWGAMGLMAVAGAQDPAVVRAINWLVENQTSEGDWDEPWFTGTGFPRVFYLKYHLYRLYFPLTALARYQRLQAAS
ncbi:MAG: squalene--hopene cyclase [Phycisphaerales bacterium]|nr:squalene--hopene cyclase [Phycisphaerales bacterium]